MKHKAGLYRFERSADLFAAIKGCQGDTLEIRLTEKEAQTIFKDELFQRLGFVGWTYLGE
jgi:hypothetical protein